ncbi:hypothetical protein [Alteromonas sp. W364]|uniref:hypothetical protein n=1 Tax=Alteromonas sp. W364 TaxID=3075610 RepID=UPI002888658D|nr:hypothetical protein [Alteromonas sp. W364]MDT0627460.1 hypothetical protein [Alteromonas sp. W364]
MTALAIILFAIGIVLFLVVLVDMFKKNVLLGVCGIVLFPIVFLYVIFYYSGNRKVVAPLLYFSWIIPNVYIDFHVKDAQEDLAPFFDVMREEKSINCEMTSFISTSNNTNTYKVLCAGEGLSYVKFQNIDEMQTIYKTKILLPMLEVYFRSGQIKADYNVIIGLLSPVSLYACYKITRFGEIKEEWVSNIDTGCG